MNRMSQGILAKLSKKSKTESKPSPKKLPDPTEFDLGKPHQSAINESLSSTLNSHLQGFQLPGELADQELVDTSSTTFVPVHYQSSYDYPVLVWLHSATGDQRELFKVMPTISERNFIGLSVSCGTTVGAYRAWQQDADLIQRTIEGIQSALEGLALRVSIDPNRIFIAGADAGGTMAFRVAFRRPTWFAGVGSLNGPVPTDQNPLGNLKSCRNLPVFWAHGRSSVNLPESQLCQQLRLLHTAGFDVTLRQYPCGDHLIEHVYQDMNRWMMDVISKDGANVIA